LQIKGPSNEHPLLKESLTKLYQQATEPLEPKDIHLTLNQLSTMTQSKDKHLSPKAKNKAQQRYLDAISQNVMTFGTGPAGTGKTYLAVLKAVQALKLGEVERLIFVRPAVEAGEKLGFLPGDMLDKVLPYLRPVYDALYSLLGVNEVQKLIQANVIEIAPLAYMRGRTLNDAFVILDEAQNTTVEQMKMFLTRLGFGSSLVITGDITQTDLPRSIQSGLSHAIELLKDIKEVSVVTFSANDVVRHPLVSKIINAYDGKD
jgi:phosphate starvation-inducible PhoH-like protein